MKMIPYGRQFIDKQDINVVKKALHNQLITTGKEVEKFEKLFSKKTGGKFSVTCSSGTTGLLLAYLALQIKKGEVIVSPSINFIASVNMANFIGAKIYLTDVDPFTGHMRPVDLENCIKKNKIKKINTVVVMHNSGLPVDMIGFGKLKKKYKFNIIEDACHALGAKYSLKKDDNVGNCKYSDISVFSFHPLKSITTGEGGMITTNNKRIFEKLKIYRNHGIVRKKSSPKVYNWGYKVTAPGFNFRLSDFQCALGINQLKKLDKFVYERKNIAQKYKKKFLFDTNFKNILDEFQNKTSAHHLFILNLDLKKIKLSRNQIINKLFKSNIITQVHYIPIFNFPFYRKVFKRKYFKNAISYYNSCLSIPIYYGLKDKEINYVSSKIIKLLK